MLGTFGDSYADPNSWSYDTPWMTYLADKLGLSVDNWGHSGTSIWWSFEKFLTSYKNYTHIVFTYSHYDRINHLPTDLDGCHYKRPVSNIELKRRRKQGLAEPEDFLINDIGITYYKYLHNEQLQLFLYQKIYEDVETLCKENNIKVVHHFPFEPVRFSDRIDIKLKETCNILGSDELSCEEVNHFKPGCYNTLEFNVPDRRVCHLSQSNNIILADAIYKMFGKDSDTIKLDKSTFKFDRKELQKYFYK